MSPQKMELEENLLYWFTKMELIIGFSLDSFFVNPYKNVAFRFIFSVKMFIHFLFVFVGPYNRIEETLSYWFTKNGTRRNQFILGSTKKWN
jgi:hypothetical protein